MQVYIQPRESADEPVHITGIAIPPEDNRVARLALQQAYHSAYNRMVQARTDSPLSGNYGRDQFIFGPETVADLEEDIRATRRGYEEKMRTYVGVSLELGATAAETTVLTTADIFPPQMVFAGIMFGVAELNRNPMSGATPFEAPSITYIEGVPTQATR